MSGTFYVLVSKNGEKKSTPALRLRINSLDKTFLKTFLKTFFGVTSPAGGFYRGEGEIKRIQNS
jgi:hypothetical protein